jgi:hypothetical protein
MPTVQIDPTKPLAFTVVFHSPQVVAYRLWYKRPGEAKYTIFATGTDNEPSNPSTHTHVVDNLSTGSEIVYLVWLSGSGNSLYQIDVELSQNGQAVPNGSFSLQGTTDADGFAQKKDTINIV